MNQAFAAPLARFAILAALLAASPVFATRDPSAAVAEPGITATTIRLGQSCPLSGPLTVLGSEYMQGANILFKTVNERGGVHGRKIELLTKDDGYVVDRTMTNVKQMLTEGRGIFAFFGVMGTANNLALVPLIDANGIPSVAPYSGADSLRKFNENIFHLRASYGDETEKIIEQLTSVGITRIAAFYQDDAFGQAGLSGVENALKKRNLALIAKGSFEKNTVKVAEAVKTIGDKNPQAVVLLSTYKPTAAFVREMKKAGKSPQFFALSVVGFKPLFEELGTVAGGIGISQVMPYPWSASLPIVREFQKAQAEYSPQTPITYTTMEGYIAAKLAVEGLKRAGPNPTRKKFIAGLESLRDYDMGGITINFSPTNHSGSQYGEVTIVGKTGKLLR